MTAPNRRNTLDLQVLHNASQFAADLGKSSSAMEQAFSGAQDASLDELQLYRIHSGIANDLHTLGQQVAQLAQSTLVQEANHGSAAGLLREFENYRRFVIMSTDVLAVDPRVASRFWAQAQRHYSDFALFAARIEQRLTDRALQRNAQQSQTHHQLAQRMWAIGLGGLVLALTASYWLARRASLRMQSIADALVQLVACAPTASPTCCASKKLHQQSHRPVQQLVRGAGLRRALQHQHQAEEQALELLFTTPPDAIAQPPPAARTPAAGADPPARWHCWRWIWTAFGTSTTPAATRWATRFASRGPAPAHHHPGL